MPVFNKPHIDEHLSSLWSFATTNHIPVNILYKVFHTCMNIWVRQIQGNRIVGPKITWISNFGRYCSRVAEYATSKHATLVF